MSHVLHDGPVASRTLRQSEKLNDGPETAPQCAARVAEERAASLKRRALPLSSSTTTPLASPLWRRPLDPAPSTLSNKGPPARERLSPPVLLEVPLSPGRRAPDERSLGTLTPTSSHLDSPPLFCPAPLVQLGHSRLFLPDHPSFIQQPLILHLPSLGMPYDPVRDSASSYPSTVVRPSSSSSASSASVAFPPPSPSFAHSAPPAISPTNFYSSGTPWPAAPGASSPLEYFQARPRPEQTKRLSLADLCGPGTSTSSPPPSHHSSLSPHVAAASVPGFSAGPPHPPAFSLTTTPSRLAPPPPTHPGHASTSSPAIPEGFSSEHALAPSSSNFIKGVPMSRRKDSTGSIASSNGGGGGDGSRRGSKGALELSPSSSTRMLSGAGPVLSYPAVTVGDSSASRRNGAGGHEHPLSTSNSDGRRLSSSSSASSPTTVASTLLPSTTSRPASPATQTSAASARPPSSSSSSSSSLHNLLSGPSSQFQEQRQKFPSVAPPPPSSSPANLSLAPALPSPLSPSSPMPVPYAPNRKTRPSSILNAIPLEVYDSLRRQVVPEGSKNVLRGRALGTNQGREREIEKVLSSEGASRPGSASSSGGYGAGGGAGAGGGGAAGQQQRPSGGSRPSSSGEVDQRVSLYRSQSFSAWLGGSR